MKKSIFSFMVATLVFSSGFGVALGQDKAAREQLETRTHEVNQTAKKQGMDLSLQRISTETGVPLEQVQAMHKKHSDVGAGGLMIACVLANETKKAPEEFLKKNAGGKSWAALAKENNVSVNKLNERLSRLENAIGTEKIKSGKSKKSK